MRALATPTGRAAVALVVVAVLAPTGAAAGGVPFGDPGNAPAHQSDDRAPNPCVGTVTEPPPTTTLVTIQGARGSAKTDALLVGLRPDGSVVGVHDDTAHGRWWVYDVDRLPSGNLLLATTEPGITVVEEVDPETGEHASVRRFEGVEDAHDADLINGDELVMVDKHEAHERVLVYNLTREEVVWEYRFDEHPESFPRSGGGPYGEDWTHVNDVDRIRPGVFVVSVRNFDQVIAIDRETKEVLWRLGADDDHEVLFEQHNPDYLGGEDGSATVLVADSRNDRVVEYARTDDGWERTWVLRGGGLDEPRDADRLPNGNTLVVDRRGHRVLEVTPRGEVVWEVYTPWQPYDAERVGTADESMGPTMREAGATGVHEVTGSAGFDTAAIERCSEFLAAWDGGNRLIPEGELDATPYGSPTIDSGTHATGGDGENVLGEPGGWLPGGATLAGAAVVLLLVLGAVGWWVRR